MCGDGNREGGRNVLNFIYIYIHIYILTIYIVEIYIVPKHVELKFDAPFGPAGDSRRSSAASCPHVKATAGTAVLPSVHMLRRQQAQQCCHLSTCCVKAAIL